MLNTDNPFYSFVMKDSWYGVEFQTCAFKPFQVLGFDLTLLNKNVFNRFSI